MKATNMGFQWLEIRIAEEKERRERESAVQARLPRALEELFVHLQTCAEAYREAFGAEAAEISRPESCIQVNVRHQASGEWRQSAQIRVQSVLELPGFRVENGGTVPVDIEVGTLPDGKLLFKHQERYLTMEQVTRLILDPAFFPNLRE